MEKIVAALAAQQDDLTTLISSLDADGWQTPSRCPGWSVADVVLHLAQTNEMALGSVRGQYATVVEALTGGLAPAASVDDGAGMMVAAQRGAPVGDLFARWEHSATTLRVELLASDPSRRVTWVAGELSARTLATTRLAETWIHTGDVAVPLGAEVAEDDRLWHISRLAWRTLPYAFAQSGRALAGPVAFDLAAANGDVWHFSPEDEPATVVEGAAVELCTLAGQRVAPADTGLVARGPDAAAVLSLVRTFA